MRQSSKRSAASQDPIPASAILECCFRARDVAAWRTPAERALTCYLIYGWAATAPAQPMLPIHPVGFAELTGFPTAEVAATLDDLIRRRIIGVNGNLYYLRRKYWQWANAAGEPILTDPQLYYAETGNA